MVGRATLTIETSTVSKKTAMLTTTTAKERHLSVRFSRCSERCSVRDGVFIMRFLSHLFHHSSRLVHDFAAGHVGNRAGYRAGVIRRHQDRHVRHFGELRQPFEQRSLPHSSYATSSNTAKRFPAGSLNQAMSGP